MSIIVSTPRMKPAPKIEIDRSQCTTPMDCRRCLQICHSAVFWVEATAFPRLRELDHRQPGTYKLKTVYRYDCTLCNECVNVCPKGAITITLAEEESE